MNNNATIASKPTPKSARRDTVLTPSDLSQKQRQFADALDKARGKPPLPRGKSAEDLPVGALMTVATGFAAIPLSPTAATASTDAAFAAHIERIAAAIAEVSASGANAETHVQLPPGPTRIDGAVLGRNDLGQIHIVLTTASAIAPATAAQLQSQLTERLLRRDIRVAKMGLQRINRRG